MVTEGVPRPRRGPPSGNHQRDNRHPIASKPTARAQTTRPGNPARSSHRTWQLTHPTCDSGKCSIDYSHARSGLVAARGICPCVAGGSDISRHHSSPCWL
ncbi:hypothetical protein FRACA_1620007 [Frankia canadensis]|uniref:Uncharacterized protein n=1 Tax=Frankia canadensis TaxID=1836972 RepID=A0A2I2KMP8_9ACTN|nr:hypothetical protein FRACA_1620007 [Frankia canadensis]SOU54231.1 hypothetical protein FRACA_1620007 [Frankia canadensis]